MQGGNFAFGYNGSSSSRSRGGHSNGIVTVKAPSTATAAAGGARSIGGDSAGTPLLDRALEAVRAEAERMWMLANIVIVMSTAGGTV